MQPRRKQLRRFENENEPRYLTFSCYHRLPLLEANAVKDRFVEHLARTRERLRFRIHAWVVMPEHVHMIIVPSLPEASVPAVLKRLKGQFAQEMIARWKRHGDPILGRLEQPGGGHRLWQAGGGYDRNVRSHAQLIEEIEYIHENPVKRKLVSCATDWQWSSARWYAGFGDPRIAIDSPEAD